MTGFLDPVKGSALVASHLLTWGGLAFLVIPHCFG